MIPTLLIEDIQRIRTSDIITESDLWDLANHLNQDPDTRHTWPGSDLFPLCQNAYTDDLVDANDLQPILDFIRRIDIHKMEELSIETKGLPEIPDLKIRRLQLNNTSANGLIASTPLPPDHNVSLLETKCDCEDWGRKRSHFPINSPGRLCEHLASSIARHCPSIVTNPELNTLVQHASGLRIGLEAEPNWMSVITEEHRFVAAWGTNEDLQFFALGPATRVTHSTFQGQARSWSIGTRRDHVLALEPFIANLGALSPGGTPFPVV